MKFRVKGVPVQDVLQLVPPLLEREVREKPDLRTQRAAREGEGAVGGELHGKVCGLAVEGDGHAERPEEPACSAAAVLVLANYGDRTWGSHRKQRGPRWLRRGHHVRRGRAALTARFSVGPQKFQHPRIIRRQGVTVAGEQVEGRRGQRLPRPVCHHDDIRRVELRRAGDELHPRG